MVLTNPIRMMGFLPNLSDAVPHGTAVALCDIENMAPVMPAHRATSFFSMPKLAIISGRYGKTDVNASGSANRATAAMYVSYTTAYGARYLYGMCAHASLPETSYPVKSRAQSKKPAIKRETGTAARPHRALQPPITHETTGASTRLNRLQLDTSFTAQRRSIKGGVD